MFKNQCFGRMNEVDDKLPVLKIESLTNTLTLSSHKNEHFAQFIKVKLVSK